MISAHALQPIASLAATALVAGLWQGLALAAAIWLLLVRLSPQAAPIVRFQLWAAVFVAILLLPAAELLLPHRGGGAAVLTVDPRWSLAITGVWLSLSIARGIALAIHAWRLRALLARATPVVLEPALAALLAGASRRAVLCLSDEIDRPAVVGFRSPRVLVPGWLHAQLAPEELKQVLLHEIEHLRRRDDWLNLLQKLSLVLVPCNPALIWVERRLCLERELACDDGVLRRTRAPRAYASCLTAVAEHGLDRRAASLALGALERQSELARRVHRILRRPQPASPRYARALTATAALGLAAAGAGLARCPQAISFGRPAATIASAIPAPLGVPVMTAVRYAESAALAPRLTLTRHEALPTKRKRLRHRPLHQPMATLALPDLASALADAQPLQSATPQPAALQPEPQPTLVRYAIVPSAAGWLLIRL